MGYHKRKINKGELGKSSKIREELEELEDALEQNNIILALCELADLYGAMSSFVEQNFSDISMEDIQRMARATERAFKDGSRKS